MHKFFPSICFHWGCIYGTGNP